MFSAFTFGWTSSRVCLCLWMCPSLWRSSVWIHVKGRIRCFCTGLEGEEYDERYGTKSENSGDIARAGRASRAGTRAGRLVRVVRLIRVVKLYSSLQQKKNAKKSKRNLRAQSLEVL